MHSPTPPKEGQACALGLVLRWLSLSNWAPTLVGSLVKPVGLSILTVAVLRPSALALLRGLEAGVTPNCFDGLKR
jgi:hypothetical protein